MKPLPALLLLASGLLVLTAARSQDSRTSQPGAPQLRSTARQYYGLPDLHQITVETLSPSYSCRPRETFAQGYEQTALFLSAYSKRRNSPELLFNGACGSKDNFDVHTAGAQLDVITDYGDIPLTALAAQQVFSVPRVVGTEAKFASRADVHAGHTYGVLINKGDIHGFFYFRVTAHLPNQRADVEYVVMNYEIYEPVARSPGFAWDATGRY